MARPQNAVKNALQNALRKDDTVLGTNLRLESSLGNEIRVGRDSAETTDLALTLFSERAKEAIEKRGRFSVLLSGGSSPVPFFRRLPELNLVWERVHLFWGDERMVPPNDAQSNFGSFKKAALERLPIPSENIHRVHTELQDPTRVADEYERDLRFEMGPGSWPEFDFALQGVGPDGHTASLFPGSHYEHDSPRWVIAPYVEKLGSYRISVTLGVLNHCRTVLFLVTGSEKAEIMRQILMDSTEHRGLLPSERVKPLSGDLHWFLDRAAASRLDPSVFNRREGF